MTPKKKTGNSTTLAMERKLIEQSGDQAGKTSLHAAGGEHSGIVINKEVQDGGEEIPAHLCLEFRVFLVNIVCVFWVEILHSFYIGGMTATLVTQGGDDCILSDVGLRDYKPQILTFLQVYFT